MNKPRFVLDANVIISAFLFKASQPRLALETAKKQGKIVLSETVSSLNYYLPSFNF